MYYAPNYIQSLEICRYWNNGYFDIFSGTIELLIGKCFQSFDLKTIIFQTYSPTYDKVRFYCYVRAKHLR